MLSLREKEIIERCLAISIWNHRLGKSTIKENLEEVETFQSKIKKEIQVLETLINKEISDREDRKIETNKLSKIMKLRSFLNRIVKKEGKYVSIS